MSQRRENTPDSSDAVTNNFTILYTFFLFFFNQFVCNETFLVQAKLADLIL